MPDQPTPADLPETWRSLATQQRRFGADAQARILEFCADELTAALLRGDNELLGLARAAEESGYSVDHLGRLVREGKIPNSGRKAKPLIRKRACPERREKTRKKLVFRHGVAIFRKGSSGTSSTPNSEAMMPKTKQPKAEKKCWSESFGFYGTTIRIAERKPGGVLYLLWLDKQGKQQKRSLGHCDRKQGRKQALELANALAGASGRGIQVEVAPVQETTVKPAAPLTLAEGIALAFDPVQGMYPTQSKHSRESRRLAERGAEILGRGMRWTDLTPGKIQYLVRVLARGSKDGRGARTAEYMCDMLYGVASWLRQEELIPDTAALPKRNWKVRLKQEWQALTGSVVQPKRPRHAVGEVAAIFGALPSADPRLRLLVELAAELRAGQAVRAKRSDLILDPVGGFGLGRFVVHGRGKKHGEVVDLHPELRELVDEVLTVGYLADVEAAFRRGEAADYYLFPSGRLKQGKALVDRATRQPLGSTAIRDMFRALEKVAGVEHQEGRSFYGLRRQATDLAPEFAQDARVLNRLTGHLDSSTRERVYQDPQNERVRARAAAARRNMRQYLGRGKAA